MQVTASFFLYFPPVACPGGTQQPYATPWRSSFPAFPTVHLMGSPDPFCYFPKLNYSLLPICKTGKITFLCFYTDALIPSNSMRYMPVTVPYLCSYTCRTEGLSRNQTSGSSPFRICKFLSWFYWAQLVLINFAQSSLIWTLEFWQPKSHFWKYVLPVIADSLTD